VTSGIVVLMSRGFNCFVHTEDVDDTTSLAKWSSLDLLTEEDLDATSPTVVTDKQGQFA
jgi:hypothetical protein